MAHHGEKIVDQLGAEVDRIEQEIKVRVFVYYKCIEEEVFFLTHLLKYLNTLLFEYLMVTC